MTRANGADESFDEGNVNTILPRRTVLFFPAGLLPALCRAQNPKPPVDLSQFGRGEGRFSEGQMAPDFTLKKLHSQSTCTLSSFRGHRPVALIFGSFT